MEHTLFFICKKGLLKVKRKKSKKVKRTFKSKRVKRLFKRYIQMKHYYKYALRCAAMAVLMLSALTFSACGDDEEGGNGSRADR